MDKLPFKSGQPLLPHERDGFGRTLDDALRDFQRAPEDRRRLRRKRFYDRPGNQHTRRITQRIIGERDDS